eukprot:3176441-Pleurochrysis_carterae.AAC.1
MKDMTQQSVYRSIHLLYDHITKHYEYFDRDAGDGMTHREPKKTRERGKEEREIWKMGQAKEEKRSRGNKERQDAKHQTTQQGDKTDKKTGIRRKLTGEQLVKHMLETHIGTMNISGISFGYRGRYMKPEEELLKIRPGDKLREVTEMMKTQWVHLMTLTDTHLSQQGMAEVSTYLQQEGLGGGASWPRGKRETERIPAHGERRESTVCGTLREYRVARATIQDLESGKELEVYGVYMPVRNNNGERIEEIWDKVMKDVTERGTRDFLINEDFNAETEAWINKTGRTQKEEDVIYQLKESWKT